MIATVEIMKSEDVSDSCCGDDCGCGDTAVAEHDQGQEGEAGGRVKGEQNIKETVKTNYGRIAEVAKVQGGCGCTTYKNIAPDEYSDMDGYSLEADLGLGCGLPNQFAELQSGEHVLDLGSGAGIDAFISRKAVGEDGSVTGVDMTPPMIALSRENAKKLGYDNVNFVLGELENLPLEDGSVDVAISNCVFNLVPNKKRAFAEVHRVLRPGGRFSISDIVYAGQLPAEIRESVALYVGCVAGAVSFEDYTNLVLDAGFHNIAIRSISVVEVNGFSDDNSDNDALQNFVNDGGKVLSITVTGTR